MSKKSDLVTPQKQTTRDTEDHQIKFSHRKSRKTVTKRSNTVRDPHKGDSRREIKPRRVEASLFEMNNIIARYVKRNIISDVRFTNGVWIESFESRRKRVMKIAFAPLHCSVEMRSDWIRIYRFWRVRFRYDSNEKCVMNRFCEKRRVSGVVIVEVERHIIRAIDK